MLFVDEGPKDILPILIFFSKDLFPFEIFLIILVVLALATHLSEHNAEENDEQQRSYHFAF